MIKKKQLISLGVIYTVLLIVYIFNMDKWYGQVALGSVGSLTASLIYWICSNDGNEFFPLYKFIKYYNKEIRLSVSYLMKIEIDNKYLLIWNEKRHTFTPIGGVYKYFDDAKGQLAAMGYSSGVDFDKSTSKNDLRIKIKVNKIYDFFKWFSEGIGREHSVSRELHEELLIDNKSDKCALLCKMEYYKLKTVVRHRNEDHKGHELHCFDIFVWKMNERDEKIFRDMITKYPKIYILASKDEINQRKLADGRFIGDNCYSII